MSDNELGSYLRTLREAVRPADVGLPGGARRRTPGLRRAELATLAGVSVEYLTRLEQGRDRNPSPQVLGALADVLRLPPAERLHLHHLVKVNSGGSALCPGMDSPPARAVRPTVRAVLARLEPAPAVLLNRLYDVLAHTTGYDRLAGPLGVLDGDPPNLARHLFTDARARAAYPEWERLAAEQAVELKRAAALADEPARALVNELTVTAGAAFTDRLSLAAPPRAEVHHVTHPEAGELRLTTETLELADADQRLVVYLPADTATAEALGALTDHAGALAG
ncbi:helix-turn-helix domain-containing protein [Nonomuraea sp. SBT364]|uniref:helix-turn-helix domain-containing protein n=1 Tax=Nonomuraea sp. SBT364 TaxID=1580530 RepID=UPI00066E9E88|nr:helix-turn-helix transcriptional regulator [Nonomuraea sp. SBT364]